MRTLEAIIFNKLNILHLHATDSQSSPLEIPLLPDLALKGAYHPSQIWTGAEFRELQKYGACRGIEIYVEVDMPGHTASIHQAFPSLIMAYNKQPWNTYALKPPSGQLKLNCQEVQHFLATLLDDLLPPVLPCSSRFHVGGDELNTEAYNLDPNFGSSSKDMIRPILQSFFDHDMGQVKSRSLTPVAWEEILLDWELDLPKNTLIHTWRSHSALASVVAKRYRALVGSCEHWHLDCGFGSWLDPNRSNPDTPIRPPYLDWDSPYTSWRQIYPYNPLADIPDEH